MVGQGAGDERPDDRWHHPCPGQGREHTRPQDLVVRPPHQHVDGDDDDPAAHALDGAPRDERPHRLGGTSQHKAGGEQRGATKQRQPGATTVADLAGQDHAEQAGREEGGEGERVQRHAVQGRDRLGHRRRDGHRLERDEDHGDDDADRQPPVLRAQDAGRADILFYRHH
jgi:hypothetical protein